MIFLERALRAQEDDFSRARASAQDQEDDFTKARAARDMMLMELCNVEERCFSNARACTVKRALRACDDGLFLKCARCVCVIIRVMKHFLMAHRGAVRPRLVSRKIESGLYGSRTFSVSW